MIQIAKLLPSTSTNTITNTITNSTSTNYKKSKEVKRIASYLQDLLKPDKDYTKLFMKYAWKYNEAILIRYANEALERDKQGNPTKFFNFLVSAELGYKKS